MLDSLKGAVSSGACGAAFTVAQNEIKKHTGKDIEVVGEDIPADWTDWMCKTGANSLCIEDTWDFLEKSEGNKRKVELWEKRDLKKIVMKVNDNPEEDFRGWVSVFPEWKEGSTTLTLTWFPYAKTWGGGGASWLESGYKNWWIIRDEIVFGLQLYQLPGKCFYKSDWMDNWDDVDPDSLFPNGTKKFKRWLQFRHWVLYWYRESQWGWNYQWTEKPPKNPDGSEFNLDKILSLPSMPNLKMPQIKLPSLPGMPSMPSLPSLPSIHAPSLSMPSIHAPSLSAPSLGSLPSLPPKKLRPKGRWECHGIIELEGLKAKAKGSKLVLSNATITNFWHLKDGGWEDEKKEHQRLELETTSSEQAESWVETLKASGVEEGEVGGCCTVA